MLLYRWMHESGWRKEEVGGLRPRDPVTWIISQRGPGLSLDPVCKPQITRDEFSLALLDNVKVPMKSN